MTRYHQPRIGPDRRVRERRAPRPGPEPPPPAPRRRVRWAVVLMAALALGGAAFIQWTRTAAGGSPLDRAEVACRQLHSPGDSLAAGIQAGVELRRGRFGPADAPAAALTRALALDDSRVLRRWTQHVGDYDVAAMWVRLPEGDRHALVVGWIEASGLAICRFRFAGRGATLSPDEVERGDDLLDRVLVPGNFRRR